ncbi:MAG: VanZ family protein [Spirochaetales bacterium]|nr:VanZ family protein [Spirochaetales bacterium]
MSLNNTIRIAAFWGFIFIIISVSLLSLLPRPLPNLPDKPGLDKILHFIAYTAVGFTLHLYFHMRPRGRKGGVNVLWLVLLFCIIYGGAIEILQGYTGRSPEWFDLLADGAGGLFGAFLSSLLLKLLPEHHE